MREQTFSHYRYLSLYNFSSVVMSNLCRVRNFFSSLFVYRMISSELQFYVLNC